MEAGLAIGQRHCIGSRADPHKVMILRKRARREPLILGLKPCLSTFLISHLQLFGLSQVYARLRRGELPAPRFVTPLFYRHVRHPLYVGLLLAFWAAPTITTGRNERAGARWLVWRRGRDSRSDRDRDGTRMSRREQHPALTPSTSPGGIGQRSPGKTAMMMGANRMDCRASYADPFHAVHPQRRHPS